MQNLPLKSLHRLRLFTPEGIEIFQDDIEFLKNDSHLFVSKGEEFDPYSSFAEYEILKQLGEGGFGKVFLAKQRKTDDLVAIKFVNASLIGNAEDIDMIFREAELLSSIYHKNIVKIYNTLTLSNMEVAFIMEFLEGGELLEYVQARERLSEDETRGFMKQIVDAIGYCHNQKLIHRDLKLENIVDFGIAGVCSSIQILKKNAGSLMYISPEVANQISNCITPAVDVWALGVMMFGMLYGDLPFNAKNPDDILEKIKIGAFNFPSTPKISHEAKDLISKMLTVDFKTRPNINEIYDHPWLQNKVVKLFSLN